MRSEPIIKAHEEAVGLGMITLQIHAKAQSRQCGPLFIMFWGLSRMFHQPEKYGSDFTDTHSVQVDSKVCNWWTCASKVLCINRERRRKKRQKKKEM